MHILTVAYGQPTDPAAFDAHYESTHLPLAQEVPGVRHLRALQGASLDDGPAPYHLVVELTFDSLEELRAGLSSPQGQAAAADVPNFADGGATLFIQHD
ncbi:MAG: ethyl tert-butyl ether degradation protein EthD [Klenkia sp.]|nr:ethyl tert-butyl ether degradation protein EthD [Klenkia sp.]